MSMRKTVASYRTHQTLEKYKFKLSKYVTFFCVRRTLGHFLLLPMLLPMLLRITYVIGLVYVIFRYLSQASNLTER